MSASRNPAAHATDAAVSTAADGMIRQVPDRARAERLMCSAIADLGLDLTGISVLTEAASGPFAVTPLMAAMAGAERVHAVTRDSRFGTADAVERYVGGWAESLGVADRVHIVRDDPGGVARQSSLVTNLGFVRPIDARIVALLPPDAAIALMWEPWEFRPQDVDLDACRARGVPVLGTWEEHPRLRIFRYLGPLAAKLLFEAEIEILDARVLVVASDPFGPYVERTLASLGAEVCRISPLEPGALHAERTRTFLEAADAIVVAEQRDHRVLIGGTEGIPAGWLAPTGPTVIHISGIIDGQAVDRMGIRRLPAGAARPGYMVLTTDYLGPRPVIDLHAGGLKVGEALVRGMRTYGEPARAVDHALSVSPAMDFETVAEE